MIRRDVEGLFISYVTQNEHPTPQKRRGPHVLALWLKGVILCVQHNALCHAMLCYVVPRTALWLYTALWLWFNLWSCTMLEVGGAGGDVCVCMFVVAGADLL